jgi:hypothetical protein
MHTAAAGSKDLGTQVGEAHGSQSSGRRAFDGQTVLGLQWVGRELRTETTTLDRQVAMAERDEADSVGRWRVGDGC